jgi:hypothetical protein
MAANCTGVCLLTARFASPLHGVIRVVLICRFYRLTESECGSLAHSCDYILSFMDTISSAGVYTLLNHVLAIHE